MPSGLSIHSPGDRNPGAQEEDDNEERESNYADVDVEAEDSDFDPNSDGELLSLFFPEVGQDWGCPPRARSQLLDTKHFFHQRYNHHIFPATFSVIP